jgi:HEAT repeat protein
VFLWLFAGVLVLSHPLDSAQEPGRPGIVSAEEARVLGQGWTLVGEGRMNDALNLAVGALTRFPESVSVLTLAVEAEIGTGGATSALGRYESWLGARTAEEPGVLRIIARATLSEFAADDRNPRGQVAALKALAEAGDLRAAERLQALSRGGNLAGTRALAEMGDPQALNLLILELGGRTGNKRDAIEFLGRSGSPLALDVLSKELRDPEPAVRGAAADALGRLNTQAAIDRLRPVLQDESAHVRVKAAGALLRLGDTTGREILTPLAASADPHTRLVAAQALEGRPDEAWKALVRELLAAPDPDIRLAAARLLAPHDPAVSRLTLEALGTAGNPAIREAASHSLAADVPGDLQSLRRLLKSPERLTRIAAAARILSLTR